LYVNAAEKEVECGRIEPATRADWPPARRGFPCLTWPFRSAKLRTGGSRLSC